MAFWKSVDVATAVVGALLTVGVSGKNNGLARTPQMGWDNWNALGCSVSEELLVQTANLIVKYGLKDLGYHYVILDDCWSAGRDASKTLIADPKKFPRGMKAVADDIHELGLGFGMYSDAGRYTCGQFEGSLGHETEDAKYFAEVGIDYLKYDNCYNEGYAGNQQISSQRYRTMGDALNATGRPILYSLCNWGEDYPWNWGSTIANSWRITGDIFDTWDRYDARCPCEGPDAWNCELPGFHCSVTNIMNKAAFVVSKSQPGSWNDLDMLEVGNGAMTDAEYVAHFSMWAAVKSPLIMGNDLRRIKAQDLSILSNAAVIAVNQDPYGSSAARRWIYNVEGAEGENGHSEIQLWAGTLKGTVAQGYDDYVVLFINGQNKPAVLNATLVDIFYDHGPYGHARQVKMSWEVRDLWGNRMSNETAQAIIDASSTAASATMGNNSTIAQTGRYNATATSYAKGLAANDTLLLGTVTTTVAPSGTITATIDRHGAAIFRLRAIPTAVKKDEL